MITASKMFQQLDKTSFIAISFLPKMFDWRLSSQISASSKIIPFFNVTALLGDNVNQKLCGTIWRFN